MNTLLLTRAGLIVIVIVALVLSAFAEDASQDFLRLIGAGALGIIGGNVTAPDRIVTIDTTASED